MACKLKDFEEKYGVVGAIRWLEDMESVIDISDYKKENKVKYATHSLKGSALTWWNTIVKTRGRNAIKVMKWKAFKHLVTEKFCPIIELERIEVEFLAHKMINLDHTKYINRFNELALLVPHMVTPKNKRIGRYIWGLEPPIRAYVRTARPSTFQSVVEFGGTLTDEMVRCGKINQERVCDKRKCQDNRYKRREIKRLRDLIVGGMILVKLRKLPRPDLEGSYIWEQILGVISVKCITKANAILSISTSVKSQDIFSRI
ncbi:hypothetical protein E3N88_29866 [Mikania micrantha]|uniref:Retrotransposon gag domain-containing protein n=1 Tax=Mikania micrantha TaxID=192012 RepID=A0A5N6MKF6_9ASTR|nr:hypothetical protein E3N88_29866 [Mikania micrantha]